MVQKQADQIRIRRQLGRYFTPGSPVSSRDLLAGRLTQIDRVMSAIGQTGYHAVVYGERGVGKTSLAGLVHEIWSRSTRDSQVIAPRVNCDGTDDFVSIWKKVAEEIRIIIEKKNLAKRFDESSEPFVNALNDLETGEATPGIVRRALDMPDFKLIVVLDEFDRLEDVDAIRMMADTIKSLSDHTVDATVIIVGVADSVDELVHEHESIDRCMMQVIVPRMSVEELGLILDNGLRMVGMDVQDEAKRRIVELAQGLPHYVHLLGLTSALKANEANRLLLQLDDVQDGLQEAIERTQESIRNAYYQATYSPRQENLYRQVLLACALATTDELGYFSPANVRDPMSEIMKKRYEIPAFVRHLHELCTPGRGNVLTSTGNTRRQRYRFRNPLVEPYVLIRGFHEGLIPPGLLTAAIS